MKPELDIPEGAYPIDYWADGGYIIISAGDRYAYVYREIVDGEYEVSLGFRKGRKKLPVTMWQTSIGIEDVQTIITTFFTAPEPL